MYLKFCLLAHDHLLFYGELFFLLEVADQRQQLALVDLNGNVNVVQLEVSHLDEEALIFLGALRARLAARVAHLPPLALGARRTLCLAVGQAALAAETLAHAVEQVVLDDRAVGDELVGVELGHRVLERVLGVVDYDRLVEDVVRVVQQLQVVFDQEELQLD